MNTLSFISEYLITGFVLSVFVLLLGYFILPGHNLIIKKLITLSTYPLILGSTIFLLLIIFQLFSIKNIEDDFERFAISNRMFGPFWYLFWSIAVFKGILPQILWIKKLRNNIPFLILLLPLLLIEFYLPLITNLITHLNRTHLPSSWSVVPNLMNLLLPILVYTIYLTVSFMLTRIRKVV